MICCNFCPGMVSSREGTLGKMEFMAQTAQSLQEKTSHMFYKSRIKLVATSISPLLLFTKLQVAMVA